MITRRTLAIVLAIGAGAGAAGCRLDMQDQPRVEVNSPSDFFADGRGNRPLVKGVVARGSLVHDAAVELGKAADGAYVPRVPVPVTQEVLARGRERYDIYCAPCHARTGDGLGMIVQRGYKQPPSFHEERLRAAPPGYLYETIASGFGVMPSYAAQVPVADRWAIVAYIGALQLSQHATLADVPADERARLEAGAPAAPAPPPAGGH